MPAVTSEDGAIATAALELDSSIQPSIAVRRKVASDGNFCGQQAGFCRVARQNALPLLPAMKGRDGFIRT